MRHPESVDLVDAMRHLRVERRIRALLCEGGPTLHAELIAAGLVDELFLTRAPKLAGGDGPGLLAGLDAAEHDLELIWLLTNEEGELYARYRVT